MGYYTKQEDKTVKKFFKDAKWLSGIEGRKESVDRWVWIWRIQHIQAEKSSKNLMKAIK